MTGRALVDLDAVRTQKKRAWTDPLGYLTGRLPVTAAGTLTTKNGVGRFAARVGADLRRHGSRSRCCRSSSASTRRTAENPAGINMDEPFKLPAAIREIRIGQGTTRRLSSDPLQGSLQFLKGVGPRRAADLQRAGLSTVEDLLYRFPTRYEDRGHFQTIASLKPGVAASVAGEVLSCGIRPTRRPRFKIFEMLLRDQTGSLRAIWFNQPFLKDVFHPHQRVILFGKLELTSHGLQMQSPQYEILGDDDADAGATARATRAKTTRADRRPSTPAASSPSTRRPGS